MQTCPLNHFILITKRCDWAGVTSPSHGSAVISGRNILYTPRKDFHGSDSFQYCAKDDSDAETGQDSKGCSVTNLPAVIPPSFSLPQNPIRSLPGNAFRHCAHMWQLFLALNLRAIQTVTITVKSVNDDPELWKCCVQSPVWEEECMITKIGYAPRIHGDLQLLDVNERHAFKLVRTQRTLSTCALTDSLAGARESSHALSWRIQIGALASPPS
jgi:hypothetical protein